MHAQSRFVIWQKNATEQKQARLAKEAADKAEAERRAKEVADEKLPVSKNHSRFVKPPKEEKENQGCGCTVS